MIHDPSCHRFAILEEHKENEKKVLVQQRRLRGGQVTQGGRQEAEPAYRQSPNKVVNYQMSPEHRIKTDSPG